MGATFFAWLLVVLAWSCAAKGPADSASRFFAVHNVMSALGMAQLGGVSQGTLAAGQEVKLPLTLPASCVAIVAMGGGASPISPSS